MPKQAFSGKLKKKKSEKLSCQWDHLLAIKWKDICDVFFLATAHEDVLVEAPSSMGDHHKTKPEQCWTSTSVKLVWTDQTRCHLIIHLKVRQ